MNTEETIPEYLYMKTMIDIETVPAIMDLNTGLKSKGFILLNLQTKRESSVVRKSIEIVVDVAAPMMP